SIQSAAKTGLHVGHHFRSLVRAHRFRGLEAHPIFLAGMADGRFSLGAALALPHYVGNCGFCCRTLNYGGSSWMAELRFHVHRVEEGPGLFIEIVAALGNE